jgi:hypothetical protein
MGSATVPVAVFGVAPKTRQTNLSNAVSGATPETARETRALPNRPSHTEISHRRRWKGVKCVFFRVSGISAVIFHTSFAATDI